MEQSRYEKPARKRPSALLLLGLLLGSWCITAAAAYVGWRITLPLVSAD